MLSQGASVAYAARAALHGCGLWREPGSAILSRILAAAVACTSRAVVLSQPSQQRCISANILGRREPALPSDIANLPCTVLGALFDTFVYPSPDEDDCAAAATSVVGGF